MSQMTSTSVACTSGSPMPVGSAPVIETVQRPSASTEIRCVMRSPRGTEPTRATEAVCMVSDRVRNAAPAPVGMRYSGTAACSRSRLTATPPSRATAEARIGSASKRPMIQPVASSRRASTEPGTPPPS